MDDDLTIKIQKLKGASNYRIWSAEISAYLEGKGLLNVTLGLELCPNEPATGPTPTPSTGAEDRGPEETPLEKWKRKDAKSRSRIMTHCQTYMKDKIVHLQTAKEM
jgi:hypothetical protein